MLWVDLISNNRVLVCIQLWARREASSSGAASGLPDFRLLVGFGHWEAEPRKQKLGRRWVGPFLPHGSRTPDAHTVSAQRGFYHSPHLPQADQPSELSGARASQT